MPQRHVQAIASPGAAPQAGLSLPPAAPLSPANKLQLMLEARWETLRMGGGGYATQADREAEEDFYLELLDEVWLLLTDAEIAAANERAAAYNRAHPVEGVISCALPLALRTQPR